MSLRRLSLEGAKDQIERGFAAVTLAAGDSRSRRSSAFRA